MEHEEKRLDSMMEVRMSEKKKKKKKKKNNKINKTWHTNFLKFYL